MTKGVVRVIDILLLCLMLLCFTACDTSKAYTYGQEDMDRMRDILLENVYPLEQDYRYYDFNHDDELTLADLVMLRYTIIQQEKGE